MITKNEIKRIRSLASKKCREEEGIFVVEGEKSVEEALNSDAEVLNVYRMSEIGENAMSRISFLSSPSPVLAIVKIPQTCGPDMLDAVIHSGNLSIALDGVRDPGNMGTIIRVADWFGIEAIFTSEDCVDIFNPKVVQATMGAIFRKKVCQCNLVDTLKRFKSAEKPIFGTFLEGNDINSTNLTNDGVIVMGSESNGISKQVASLVTERLFIPPFPTGSRMCESLNVAIATAITCAAFRR